MSEKATLDEHTTGAVPGHRENFTRLLAVNPNYFGNLPGSGLVPVAPLLSDTTFERLTCVGYQPERRLLEATFEVKLPYGFGGGPCTNGSWEYVRFWLDYGSGWVDAGVAGVNVHDLPAGVDCSGATQLPVSYVATLAIEPQASFCGKPVLPKVRAILSWNVEPPATASAAVPAPAAWQPVYGNILDTTVQIAPRPLSLTDVLHHLDVKEVKLAETMKAALTVPIPTPDPPPLSLSSLAQLYRPEDRSTGERPVPPHRFGLGAVLPALAAANPIDTYATIQQWEALGLNWSQTLASLTQLAGDVSYEQLTCTGLDVARGRLVATIAIKLPYGYSGNLCTAGSTEYVAFWGDFGASGCALTYLGTATVEVHDIAAIPDDGLTYSVVLPVDLSTFAQPCQEPMIGRVRAVLSWNTPPSTLDPDAVPYWGNRIDAHIQLPVAPPDSGTGPNIWAVGGIGVAGLDSAYDPVGKTTSGTGLTLPAAHFALTGTAVGAGCPFGDLVTIQGDPVPHGTYRVQVRNLTQGTVWTSLTNQVSVVDSAGNQSLHLPVGDYYPYLDHQYNEDGVLADWYTTDGDLWEIKLDSRDAAGNPLGEIQYRVRVDNTPPQADIHISNGGDCKKFAVGTRISGKFTAYDPDGHFASYSLSILPDNLPGGTGVLSPSTGTAEASAAQTWTLDTTGMSSCAYVIQIRASDKTIVSSRSVGRGSLPAAVGFALE
jgi:hypothetical protein